MGVLRLHLGSAAPAHRGHVAGPRSEIRFGRAVHQGERTPGPGRGELGRVEPSLNLARATFGRDDRTSMEEG